MIHHIVSNIAVLMEHCMVPHHDILLSNSYDTLSYSCQRCGWQQVTLVTVGDVNKRRQERCN